MSKKYLKTNLYDKNGNLLLCKGHELSESMIKRLEVMSHAKIRDMVFEKQNQSKNPKSERADLQRKNEITSKANQICKTFKVKDISYINFASETLIHILFESKNQPWWFYVNTLSNHIDWLYTHSINVAILATMIAKVLNIRELSEIALGAFFHDIGKLMIPKDIIQKSCKLTEEEIVYMRQHCDLGVSMMKDFSFPQIGLDVIAQHHECLDGSGYPKGLHDTQISIYSKIVMVANILDSATSQRPYRQGGQIELTISEMKASPSIYSAKIFGALDSLL